MRRTTTWTWLVCGLSALAPLRGADGAGGWGVYEVALQGPRAGNPFVDVQLRAQFQFRNRAVDVTGFYDGDGVYRVRFMPNEIGEWSYRTSSNAAELDGRQGRFTSTAPTAGNHGPVRVRYVTHFAYEDGAPYVPLGTTCYAWVHQGDKLEEQTMATLRAAPFNKMRMCVFPKSYTYHANEPVFHPFENKDFSRFNPKFFQHLEKRLLDLQALGIEADLILFHPYDRWGYASMPPEAHDLYLRYTVARLAAFRNVWWSLANEWDLVKTKTLADWDRFFRIGQESAPYQRLRPIHPTKVM